MEADGHTGSRNSRSALDLALQIAQQVNDENRRTTLQQRAQKVISEIIDRPGVAVSPDILFEAAQGEYHAADYPRAIEAFKGIMRRLDSRDEATRQEYAPKVLFYVGSSLGKMNRPLEAAMAYREAATTWAGDPEYQEKVAQGYYSAMRAAKSGASGDQLLEQLYLEAEKLYSDAVAQTSDAGTINFRRADRAYGEKDYTQARSLFQEVGDGSDYYEKARVKASLCLYKVKDYDGAKAEFEKYLDEYVADPTTKPTGAERKLRRSEAMAMATFYLGRIAYVAQDYGTVLKRLSDYREQFPDQGDYVPNALFMVAMAHLASDDMKGAKGVVATMLEHYDTHSATGMAAGRVYEALQTEQQALEEAGDTAGSLALKEEMVGYKHEQNELAKEPNFGNLRAESTLWIDLGRWKEAEAVLRTLEASFPGNPDVELFVLPDLGLVLLEQKRVPEAFAVLDPLIPKDDSDTRKPSSSTVRSWCRAVAGWIEGDEQNVVEVPGVGGAENLEVACKYLLDLTAVEKVKSGGWDCPWYALKLETAYAYTQWGKEDSNQTQKAVGLIKNLMDFLGDVRLDPIGDSCGDDVLQRRFLWLWEKIR